MTPTCAEGGKHRWDERRSRCLDCGREAATCAEELEDWLAQTEDSVDRLSDQIEAMRAQLEAWLERLTPASSVHRYDQGRTFCACCGGCIEASQHAAPPANVTDHQEDCPIRRTRAVLAGLEEDQ